MVSWLHPSVGPNLTPSVRSISSSTCSLVNRFQPSENSSCLLRFTGVVVENFSYVFSLTGPTSVTREEMRAFKKVWAEFDPGRTGYITRPKFVPFFGVSFILATTTGCHLIILYRNFRVYSKFRYILQNTEYRPSLASPNVSTSLIIRLRVL